MKSKLTFWGGVGAVTGSNFKLEVQAGENTGDRKNIMIDCGLFQGGGPAHEKNREGFGFDPAAIDVLLVTHAHIDHIGRIPKLVKDGFTGKIFSTRQTKEIAALMFDDTINIMTQEAQKRNEKPIYNQVDAQKALSQWETKPYHEVFNPLSESDIVCEFLDAGHILGSAMIKLTRNSRTIIFSGDVGNSPSPIVRDAEMPTGANYLILDSTYGDRNHEPRGTAEKKFGDIVAQTIKNKGTLLVPVFSLERAHIVLSLLNDLIEGGKVAELPVYLDSPLASRLTPIYYSSKDIFNDRIKKRFADGDDIFSFPKLKIVQSNFESTAIEKTPGPKIIIAGSGMSVGGRIPAHEINLLPEKNTTLLITGYQAVGTLGRAITDGQKNVMITGVPVEINAKIESIEGFSAHKDTDGLVEFVDAAKDTLEQVFIVHGEPKSSLFLVQRIRDYVGLNALSPERGKEYEIEF